MIDTVPRMRPLGLAARMILFLTLALVPIGIVAWFQTTKLQQETRLRSQLSLVALTEAAALDERETVLRAQGGAQALGATLGLDLFGPDGDDNAETCSNRLASYLAASPGYSFAGLLTVDGRIPCTSIGSALDLADFPRLKELMENPGAAAWLNQNGPISHRSVIVVAEPFYIEDALAGHVLLSVPSALLPLADDAVGGCPAVYRHRHHQCQGPRPVVAARGQSGRGAASGGSRPCQPDRRQTAELCGAQS